MIYLIPILLFFIPLAIKLRVDFNKWQRNQRVDHSKEWKWIAACESVTAGVFFIALSHAPLYYSIPVTLFMIAAWFWLLFDGLYNVIRKRHTKKHRGMLIVGQYDFWYTGSNDKDDAVSDNFLQRLQLWQHKTIKIGLIILFTTLYILL